MRTGLTTGVRTRSEGWERWWRHHKGLAWKGWFGTQSAEESLEACQAWGERFFSFYDGTEAVCA